jgi:hypothetical protein
MQSPLLGEMELEYNFSKSKKLTSIDWNEELNFATNR